MDGDTACRISTDSTDNECNPESPIAYEAVISSRSPHHETSPERYGFTLPARRVRIRLHSKLRRDTSAFVRALRRDTSGGSDSQPCVAFAEA